MKLNEKQTSSVIKVWNAYLDGGDKYIYPITGYSQKELDQHRLEVIPDVKKLLDQLINGGDTVEEFRTKVEEINKKNLLWGYNGANGQVFFELIAKTSVTAKLQIEFNNLLKETLPAPVNLDFAINNIRTFTNFLRTLAHSNAELRNDRKIQSIPYFLSYFWQIQKPDIWPIYYASVINHMKELDIWAPSGEVKHDYSDFYELNVQMVEIIESKTGKDVKLWDIEHAFWYSAIVRDIQPIQEPPALIRISAEKPAEEPVKPVYVSEPATERTIRKSTQGVSSLSLSESYIPPVVAVLPVLASNDAQVAELCKQTGKPIEKVFKERLAILFGMLGYETKSPHEGHAVALCKEYPYAIIYDAKINQRAYSIGNDEPADRESIQKIGDRLRKQGFKTIYFMIISNTFNGEYDDATRTLKIETGVNEVLLVEVDALLLVLENKLRDSDINLGPSHIQKLLAASGLLTKDTVRNFF
ncbi:MAG: hypothetical protein WCF08_05100, partial [Anaerolineaceae bacterium]